MNGFTNTILTLLLSWLKALINNIWSVLRSEDGGAFYQFLSANWKTIVLILLVGGFVADRIVYLIRWRPYYVWSSKLGRLRRPKQPESPPAEAIEPVPSEPVYSEPSPSETFMPPPQDAAFRTQAYAPPAQPAYAPQTDTRVFAPASAAPSAYEAAQPQATMQYAPMAQGTAAQQAPYASPYFPPENLEPVFDEEDDAWNESDPLVQPSAWNNPAHDMEASFGTPKPEPLAYLRDMQAGFARPLPPEQLYAPPQTPDTKEEASTPIHPGLDNAALRENFGLMQDEIDPLQEQDAWDEQPQEPMPMMHAPMFHPFTAARENEEAPAPRGRNPLARFAKRARDLVGVEDDEHRPTIHDLQSTVDVTRAFHEPVYPQSRDPRDGE